MVQQKTVYLYSVFGTTEPYRAAQSQTAHHPGQKSGVGRYEGGGGGSGDQAMCLPSGANH